MFNRYLKLAFRKFYRNKLYSLINLAGLSLAIACCLILGLYLHGELTYDQHHENHERIYRVSSEFTLDGQTTGIAVSSPVLAPMLADDFDEVEAYARIQHLPSSLISHEENAYYWESAALADASIFELFTHEIIYGDPKIALAENNTAAISETFAQRYFGSANPIGEIITVDDGPPQTIQLVFADLPENSHHKYDVLFPATRPNVAIPTDLAGRRNILISFSNLYSYILLPEGFDIDDFEQMGSDFAERHTQAEENAEIHYLIEPLTDIHLRSNLIYDQPQGNLVYLYGLIAVGLFILLVACINYINLATARSMQYSKQIGMQKILGARKQNLVTQFLAESIFLALVSVFIGVVIVELVTTLMPINELFGTTIELNLSEQPQIILWLAIIGLTIGLVTGLYPAIYLSSWAPLSVLVSDQSSGSANAGLRKALVLTQYLVSVAAVACTLLMADQMRFMSDKSLGFEKENRIAIRILGRDLIQSTPRIKDQLLQHPDILSATLTIRPPGETLDDWTTDVESSEGTTVAISLIMADVDVDYLEAMGMNLIEGRNYSNELASDSENLIVNQALVDRMGWDDPIGKRVDLSGRDNEGRVIGVVENFHFKSLHTAVEPIGIRLIDMAALADIPPRRAHGVRRFLIVNISGENISETINYLEDRFEEFDPEHPFVFQFLDDALNQFYESDQRLMNLISIFASICIFISCIGLFGLASFTTEQRNKEIGIRKTLGASAGQIVFLLSKSMLSLVFIGAILGCAFAYVAISFWLSNFAYRADMTLLPYLIASIAALLVAYLTVALQSYKTAQADPVDALRYE